MQRLLRFALALFVAVSFVPFLPFYVERTMVRSLMAGGGGDVISWGWRLRTLRGYWADYSFLRPEQGPAFWLAVNLALALAYTLTIALWVDRVLARREKRRQSCSEAT